MSVPLPDLPPDNTTICLVIPNSPEWRQIYMGSLVLLQKWWYYDVSDAESAEDVIQRVMECHYLTSQDYEGCKTMVDCSDIEDCIETSESLQSLIADIGASGQYNESISSGTYKNEMFNAESGGVCQNDVLNGMLDASITFLHEKTTDWLESYEVATNIVEFMNLLADLPIIGPLLEVVGVDLAVQWVEYLFDSLGENYLANYSVELEDEIECYLYCTLINAGTCEFNLEEIGNAYANLLAGVGMSFWSTLSDYLSYVIAGVWSGNEYVYIAHLMVIGSLYWERTIASQSWDSFKRAVLIAPPSDEYLLCPTCNFTHVFDFTVDDGGWVQNTVNVTGGTNGTYVAATGWQFSDTAFAGAGLYRRTVNIEIEFDTRQITQVIIEYDLTKGTYNPTGTAYALLDDEVVVNSKQNSALVSGTDLVEDTGTISRESSKLRVYFASSIRDVVSYSGAGLIKSITVKGIGVDPFI